MEQYKAKEAALPDELQSHSEADYDFLMSCSAVLELAKHAYDLFVVSQPDQKNRLLRSVFANASVNGKEPVYELKTPSKG